MIFILAFKQNLIATSFLTTPTSFS